MIYEYFESSQLLLVQIIFKNIITCHFCISFQYHLHKCWIYPCHITVIIHFVTIPHTNVHDIFQNFTRRIKKVRTDRLSLLWTFFRLGINEAQLVARYFEPDFTAGELYCLPNYHCCQHQY